MREDIKESYGIQKKKDVGLTRVQTKSGKALDLFPNPGESSIKFECPEFTCLCPRTGQPDFATFTFIYKPDKRCIESESLKYFLNSFRNEGHFHEQVTNLIAKELVDALQPLEFGIEGEFNVRGGLWPTIQMAYTKEGGWE